MPPVQSVPSDEVDDDVAFKVLNQDNLPINIIGESVFKPFDWGNQKDKPNVIVYPTRRIPNSLEQNKQKEFTKSNGHIYQDNYEYSLKNFSNSHGNLNHTNTIAKQAEFNSTPSLFSKFTKTLDAKLRKLQREEKSPNRKTSEANSKKPFVTTVKKGQFLEPPPEIANLLGIKVEEQQKRETNKKLYAYASRPRVLNRNAVKGIHKARCEAAAKAVAGVMGAITGIHDEYTARDFNSNISSKKYM